MRLLGKAAVVLAGVLVIQGAIPAQATGLSGAGAAAGCQGTQIRVVGATAVDFDDICRGALAARSFLAGKGLRREPVLTIEVTSRLPPVVGPDAAGCFVQEQNRAYVLPYTRFRKMRTWFGVPITRSLYQSLATHETAHAMAACNFATAQASIQAREYVAYVTMFSAMPVTLRDSVLKSLPGVGFQDIDRVSSFVYLFDPMRFGAEAYRHFITLEDGAAFLDNVMSGKILAE